MTGQQKNKKGMKDMKKYWKINGNCFSNREEAKEYLITLCANDPEEYYNNADLWDSFEEWLQEKHKIFYCDWWVDFTKGNASRIIDAVSLFRMFLPDYWEITAEDVVDAFMCEEE